MIALVDTGVLFAYLSKRDAHHRWAKACFERIQAPALTCEAVLSEVVYLLRRDGGDPAAAMKMLTEGALTLGLSVEDEAERVERILDRYAERASLADACMIRLSEMYPNATVVTTDVQDFSIYRRNGRGIIPLLTPEVR